MGSGLSLSFSGVFVSVSVLLLSGKTICVSRDVVPGVFTGVGRLDGDVPCPGGTRELAGGIMGMEPGDVTGLVAAGIMGMETGDVSGLIAAGIMGH